MQRKIGLIRDKIILIFMFTVNRKKVQSSKVAGPKMCVLCILKLACTSKFIIETIFNHYEDARNSACMRETTGGGSGCAWR